MAEIACAEWTVPGELAGVRERVDAVLEGFLADKARRGDRERLPADLVDALHSFVFGGGKRIRPLLCVLGWFAAGGSERLPLAVIRVAAALELQHAAVLIHRDVIERRLTRRGFPTLACAMAARFAHQPDRDRRGRHAAVLVGDLALVWSDELLFSAHLSARQRTAACAALSAMRGEVIYGHYLDLRAAGEPAADLERALEIIRYKTVGYTCERPLQLGARLAGTDENTLAALSVYARALGEAVHLAEDLHRVYGDRAGVGSRLEDLRAGKHTALVASALDRAVGATAVELRALLGNPGLDLSGATLCRDIMTEVGARAEIERMITERRAHALRAVDDMQVAAPARAVLRELAEQLTNSDG
ncbi:polyprenyl synthetase family protein [Nocardia sp. CDC160]|uniref:polyprenyl synthetase family protein n=1 Tax=Nocardia sp. CDC160 TaxID=3112166 RepID=UPI002DC0073C|nr:polyprenyl synthetase family protein [Nocardia sp. CDC160]MEC3919096.1 polyprenyl synthetase family protein [Nocardia sp. CDC160]